MMNRRSLGSTGRSITPIGLGLAALGRPGYMTLGHADDLEGRRSVEGLERHTHHMLDVAWDLGIRYFDAARSYGRAEAFLASWLASRDDIEASDLTLGSKWGYTYTADWQVDADVHEVKDHSLDVFERQWGETQSHLKGALDVYQIHSATLKTGVLDDADVHAALARLKDDGVAVGLSLSGARQDQILEKALAVTVDGERLFDTVQATWNVLEPSVGSMLATARDEGLGVIVKEALANGRLTPRATEDRVVDVLRPQAERLHTTMDALAMAAALDQPWADVVLSGAAIEDHLRSNVHALVVTLDDEAREALSSLAMDADVYWQSRDELAWT